MVFRWQMCWKIRWAYCSSRQESLPDITVSQPQDTLLCYLLLDVKYSKVLTCSGNFQRCYMNCFSRIAELEKELYFYKTTCRSLKKHLRDVTGASSASASSSKLGSADENQPSYSKPHYIFAYLTMSYRIAEYIMHCVIYHVVSYDVIFPAMSYHSFILVYFLFHSFIRVLI